jgi:ketosteroid isomerase-like protein
VNQGRPGEVREPAKSRQAAAAIDAGNERYARAFVEANAEVARSACRPDVVFVDPQAVIVGWDAFASEIARSRDHHRVLEFRIVRSSMQRAGDEAFVRGRYRFVFQRSEGQSLAFEGSFVQIWRCEESWRLWRDITVDRRRVAN